VAHIVAVVEMRPENAEDVHARADVQRIGRNRPEAYQLGNNRRMTNAGPIRRTSR